MLKYILQSFKIQKNRVECILLLYYLLRIAQKFFNISLRKTQNTFYENLLRIAQNVF